MYIYDNKDFQQGHYITWTHWMVLGDTYIYALADRVIRDSGNGL